MYYNLTKNEYKKYERKFKQTYVGKQSYLFVLMAGLFLFYIYFIPDTDSLFKTIFKVESDIDEFMNIEYYVFLGFSLLLLLTSVIAYGLELRNYIIEKIKNK